MLSIAPRRELFCVLLAILALGHCAFCNEDSDKKIEKEEGFKFRFLGPKDGNRVASIAGVPG